MEIVFSEVDHWYMRGTPFEKKALDQISLTIPSGSFTAIIGHTGSGKSTLVQHINGLLRPSSGQVRVGNHVLTSAKKKDGLKELRRKVGLVFQYPEHQLFEETVAKDICFGPINFGVEPNQALRRAKELLPLVGLEEHVLSVSPFQLSGGQMRRVAIAGVLASRPSILLLDEPAAGLDPEGRTNMMNLFTNYHEEHETTIVLVTHHMEDAVKYADHIIVMDNGKVEMAGDKELIFEQATQLREIGLDLPNSFRFLHSMKEKFELDHVPSLFEVEEIADYVAGLLTRKED